MILYNANGLTCELQGGVVVAMSICHFKMFCSLFLALTDVQVKFRNSVASELIILFCFRRQQTWDASTRKCYNKKNKTLKETF